MRIKTDEPDSVLMDAAKQLKAASRIIEDLAKYHGVITPEWKTKRLSQAIANIDAAKARIQP